MLSKRSLGYDKDAVSPSKRLRANIMDLFLSNDVSGIRTQGICDDAYHFRPDSDFDYLRRAGNYGKLPNHVHRDLLKKAFRKSKWPSLYYATVRVWDPKTAQATTCQIPLLLPHEQLREIADRSSIPALLETGGLSSDANRHLQSVIAQLGTQSVCGLGFWLDGTPCNWDRSKSVETISMNLPGQQGKLSALRFPIAVVMKQFMLKYDTTDDLLDVVAWSLRCLATGTMPTCRHDGTAWADTDAKRKALSGQPIGVRGAAVEVRGDWAMLKQSFRFPGWRETAGCCFRCDVKPDEIRTCGANSGWRHPSRRLNHYGLLMTILMKGLTICPLFSFPFFLASCVAIDWLHCCDLGVALDFLGNLFWMVLPKLPGNNQKQRIRELHLKMQKFYKDNKCGSRLDDLTVTMLRKKPSSPPKLRAKAAESRALIPFAKMLAEELLSDHGSEGAAKQAARELALCYDCLSVAVFDRAALATHSRKFCLLYTSLEAVAGDSPFWRFKPKFHLWQELCEQDVCPSTCWTYRDEDFGGSVAKWARRRGGHQTAKTAGYLVLNKFRAQHSIPRIL